MILAHFVSRKRIHEFLFEMIWINISFRGAFVTHSPSFMCCFLIFFPSETREKLCNHSAISFYHFENGNNKSDVTFDIHLMHLWHFCENWELSELLGSWELMLLESCKINKVMVEKTGSDVNYKSACLGIRMSLWKILCNRFKRGQLDGTWAKMKQNNL